MATVAKLVEAFIGWCGQHRAGNTAKQYSTRLRPFVAAFGPREFASLRPLEIDDFLARAARFPDGREKAPDTIRINAISLEQLQKFAIRMKEAEGPIFTDLEKPAGRKRQRLPEPAETAKILAGASPAFRLIYQALRQSGARPNELARATFADWDRAAGMIVLEKHKTSKKTGKPRRIAVGAELGKILAIAISSRITGPLFVSPRGKPWTSDGLTQTFSRLRDRAGLPKDLILYLARHEHATAICKAKGVYAAKEALGHANISTTEKYLHTDDAEMKANQDCFKADN